MKPHPMTLRYVVFLIRTAMARPSRAPSPVRKASASARAYTHTASWSHAASTGIWTNVFFFYYSDAGDEKANSLLDLDQNLL